MKHLFLITVTALIFWGQRLCAETGHGSVVSIHSPQFTRDEVRQFSEALGLALGQPLDMRTLNEGIRELYRKGVVQTLFVDVQDAKDGLHIVLKGNRLRKLRQLNFTNVDSSMLESARGALLFEVGKTVDIGKLSLLRDKLKSEYAENGYWFSTVDISVTDVPGTMEVDVEIEVKPGPPTIVNRIVFKGVEGEDTAFLLGSIYLKQGSIYTKSALERSVVAIQEYFLKNRYPTSKVEDASAELSEDKLRADIVFSIKMGERYQFSFNGNTVFEDVELRELLTTETLSQGNALQKIVDAIEQKYRTIGFHFVKVNAKQRIDKKSHLYQVDFEIDEGKRVIIDNVYFNGGEELGKSKLTEIFFTDAPGVIQRRLYWEAGMQEAINRAKKGLQEQGYLTSEVTGPRLAFSEDRKGVELILDADLGNKTVLQEVKINGNQHISKGELEKLLPLKVGEPVSYSKLELSKKAIVAKYKDEGFVDLSLTEEGEGKGLVISPDRRDAVLLLNLNEGKRYLVGDISIDGNRHTKAKVILRELELESGDKYSPEKIRLSEDNLAQLGLFSRFEIISSTNPTDSKKKDLKIVVSEIKPGVGEVGMGGAYEEPRFIVQSFFGMAYRNLWGLNQTASARTEVSLPISHQQGSLIPYVGYAAILGYRAPYLFDLPFTFVAQAGLDSFEISPIPVQLQTRARIEERIERKLSSKITGIYRLHHYERTTQETLDDTKSKVTESIGSTGPGLIVDFRNDSFNPTSGSYHTLDVELAHPSLLSQENLSFMMGISRNSFYFPLSDGLTFTVYAGGGYAKALLDLPLPLTRLKTDLALGGQSSIRGYSSKEYQPNPNTSAPELNPRETAFINARAEVSSVIFNNVSAAIFFDTGQLYPNWIPQERKDGVGLGFRYKTPVGPIVIDVAHGFQSREKNVKFTFTIGTI